MGTNGNPPYSLLARFYDQVLPFAEEMNRHARGKILRTLRGEVIRSACDLACGSGSTAVDLARSGLRVVAVDNSAEFCRIARRKARESGVAVRVVHADMRDFRLPEAVDLVTCEFSALNNLFDRRDLPRVFRSVARALRPGGLFLFDVNTLRSMEEQYSGTHWFEGREFKLAMRGGGLDRRARRARLDMEWFLLQGKLWRHVRETIHNVAWSDREIRAALRAAGFKVARTWDGLEVRPRFPGAKRGYDAYYLARKTRRAP